MDAMRNKGNLKAKENTLGIEVDSGGKAKTKAGKILNQYMRLTVEDRKLMALLDAWGYLTAGEIADFLGKHEKTAQWRVTRLLQAGFIRREKTPFGHYIYTVMDFRGFNIAGHDHYAMVKTVARELSAKYQCGYITERQMRSADQLERGGLATGKWPDFVLAKDAKEIAVEVELSTKNTKRIRKIIENYITLLKKGVYVQVWYYCKTKAICKKINMVAAENGSPRIKTFLLP